MNWQSFKNRLVQSPDLHLQFQYTHDRRVNASYHITEIKQAQINSVDCGGKANTWTEVVLQLWEPSEHSEARAMTVSKALKIVDLVEAKLPLDADATVKIEFGNSAFDVRQMHPSDMLEQGTDLVVNLLPDQTQCKALDRGDSCGKPKTALADLTPQAKTACCSPESSACCS